MKKFLLAGSLVLAILGVVAIAHASTPSITVGPAQSITLPTSSVSLSGSATVQSPATAIVDYSWVLTSGPAVTPAVVITQPNPTTSADATATGLTSPGNYVFTLTAKDNATPTAFSATATTTITVNPAPTVTVNSGSSNIPLPPTHTPKSHLEINKNGDVNLTGELMSNNGGVLTIKVWGITFTVNTNSANTTTSSYTIGDQVSVNGKIDTTASTPTINARVVKDVNNQISKHKSESDNDNQDGNTNQIKTSFGQFIKNLKIGHGKDNKRN